MGVDVHYLLSDAVTGTNICELPLVPTSPIQFGYNTVGQWSASMPADHPTATKANFDGVVEVSVYRNGTCEFNGPVGEVDVSSDGRTVDLTILEASAYLGLRTIETDKHYNADRFYIARKVFTEITTKLSTAGDGTASAGLTINADLPRFSVSSGSSGFTMALPISALGRRTMAEVLDKLGEDPTEGIDWCMDYRTASTRQQAHRKLVLGAPMGVTASRTMVRHVLATYGKTLDTLRGGTRWHVVGAGYVATKQNTGSITAGTLLIEQVVDRSDVSDETFLDNAAKEFRRKGQVPVKMPRLSFVPSSSVPFDAFGMGDKVPFNLDDPCDLLNLSAVNRRVVGKEWTPPTGESPELVSHPLSLPLDELGA